MALDHKKQNRLSTIQLSKVLININIDAKYIGTLRWHLPVFRVLHFKIVFITHQQSIHLQKHSYQTLCGVRSITKPLSLSLSSTCMLQTIIGQDIPPDIYRWCYIKQDLQFPCCVQYTCNMMSQVEETSLERAVNNSINNMQHGLVPQLRGESVMEISSRGQTGGHKWGERKDVRSLSGSGGGVTFQGRDIMDAS